ncbi:MAG TPA: hypothetical protein VGK41_09935 [Solirubrobacterales bacterium]
MTAPKVTEREVKRAIELVVGDRIDRDYLPRPFGEGDAEVVFLRDHQFARDSHVFVAYAYDDGYHDSTSFLAGAEIAVVKPEPVVTPELLATVADKLRADQAADPSCRGVPPGFEVDCGIAGPHGPHGPEPLTS